MDLYTALLYRGAGVDRGTRRPHTLSIATGTMASEVAPGETSFPPPFSNSTSARFKTFTNSMQARNFTYSVDYAKISPWVELSNQILPKNRITLNKKIIKTDSFNKSISITNVLRRAISVIGFARFLNQRIKRRRKVTRINT